MENKVFVNSLRNHFFTYFSMLEKIIELCPDELWNCKKSGFVFWQQLLHTFSGMLYWLREENTEFIEPFREMNVYPEMEKDPENVLSKEDITQCCDNARKAGEQWFSGKDDDWLKLPSKIYDKITNFDVMIMEIKHVMYHIGHCEAIFRENGIKPGVYLDF